MTTQYIIKNFSLCVYVWRLILKKITPVISTLQIKVLNIWLFYAFVMPSLQVRYTSVTEPFQIRSLE